MFTARWVNNENAWDSGTMAGDIALKSAQGRWLLGAMVAGSGMAMLDATVVGVALPQIGDELNADVAGLQWTVNGYMLTLAALILLSGSLADRFGRRRLFLIGIIWFALASAACAAAVNLPMLTFGRALQGVGGALLTPGSLAIISASLRPDDRAKAIGAWSGLTGVASAIGPFLGGWLIDAGSWRLIFLLNIPIAAAVVAITVRHVPETNDTSAPHRLDILGAVLISVGLGGLTYGFIESYDLGPAGVTALVVGALCLIAFVVVELRSSHPMLPPEMFANLQFTAANLVTVVVYAGLGVVFFLFVVFLQEVLNYSALQAGIASLPITVLMLLLSAKSGELAQRIGPRLQMSVGPLIVAAGILLMMTIDSGSTYLTGVLPSVLLVGFGLAVTVAPLTATVLGAAEERHAGVASGANNAIARSAQLLAVAVVPVAAGITGSAYQNPDEFTAGFHRAMLITTILMALGGLTAAVLIRNRREPESKQRYACDVGGPTLQGCPGSTTNQPEMADRVQ